MIANLGGYLEVAEEIIKMGAELNTRNTDANKRNPFFLIYCIPFNAFTCLAIPPQII